MVFSMHLGAYVCVAYIQAHMCVYAAYIQAHNAIA